MITIGKRQYVCTAADKSRYSYCREYGFSGRTILTGEELPAAFAQGVHGQYALLGEWYDPADPEASDEKILTALAAAADSRDDLLARVRKYGGRWVLLAQFHGELTVVGDACGLMQVFYSDSGEMASRYELLEDSLTPDPEAQAYIRLAKESSEEYCWLLDATPYREIRRLLPNHYLGEGAPHRYWPREKAKPSDSRIRDAAGILKGSMEAVACRHPLYISLTAGLDSRMLLASSRDLENRTYITHTNGKTGRSQVDVEIAGQISKGEGLPHILVDFGDEPGDGVTEVRDSHSLWHTIDCAMRRKMDPEGVLVKGSCAEIARNPFGCWKNRRVDARALSVFHGIPLTPWAEKRLSDWLAEAKAPCDAFGYSLQDLFYWEHRMGCWQAMCQNESDPCFQTFTPFNHGELLECLLNIPTGLRIPPRYRAFTEMLRILDPACLNYGINPQYRTVRHRISQFLKTRFPGIFLYLMTKR